MVTLTLTTTEAELLHYALNLALAISKYAPHGPRRARLVALRDRLHKDHPNKERHLP